MGPDSTFSFLSDEKEKAMLRLDSREAGALRTLIALALVVGWVAASQAEPVLIPIDPDNNATTRESSIGEEPWTGPAARTIDGSGLEFGFPTLPDTHTASNTDGWLSDSNEDVEAQWAMYDFEEEWTLSEIRFWNYHDFGGCCAARGVKDMDVYTSLDADAMGDPEHASWELLLEVRDTPIIPSQIQGEPPTPPYGEQWLVDDTNARLVMLDIVANWGGGAVAIAEIQFISDPGGVDPILGDVNLDGEVNGLDVDPFVDVLLNGPYQLEADMNQDTTVNGLDVDLFVEKVVGGGIEAVPEPSTYVLAIIGLLASAWVGRRR
jgi:hypothetical protein